LAGGIGEMLADSDLTTPAPPRAPMAAPLLVAVALREGRTVSSLERASMTNWPDDRLYSARLMDTWSTSGETLVVGVLVAMATLLSAVMLTLAPGVGVLVDWPYQLPVAVASLISTAGAPAVS